MVKIYKVRRFLRKLLRVGNRVFVILLTLFLTYFLVNNFIYDFLIWGGAQRAYEKKDYGRALVLYDYASNYYKYIRFSPKDRKRHVDAQYKIAQTYISLGQNLNAENAIKQGMFEIMDEYGFYSMEYAQYVRDYVVEFYLFKKEYTKAREFLVLSEYAYSKLHTEGSELAAINRLYGDIYLARGDEFTAFNYYQNAYRLTKKYKNLDNKVVIPIYTNIADFYFSQNDVKRGVEIYEELGKVLDMKKPDEKIKLAEINLKIAKVYESLEDYKNSIQYYEKAYEIIKKLPSGSALKENINDLRQTMANIYGKTGPYIKQREMILEIERSKRFWFKPIKL